jgi:hypothetical protein
MIRAGSFLRDNFEIVVCKGIELEYYCHHREGEASMMIDNLMRKFDPRKVAHYEKENYVAYYQKDWLKLLQVSIGLVQETFALTLWQSIYGAYLIARAEIAFAPFPENDIPLAEAYMVRFYRMVKNIYQEKIDIERIAKLEVNWWIVHRRSFGNPENQELADALADLYVEAYGGGSQLLRSAALERARGMSYSDLWVNEGKLKESPLLVKEEEALYKSYVLLKEAIS